MNAGEEHSSSASFSKHNIFHFQNALFFVILCKTHNVLNCDDNDGEGAFVPY